jgi:predicted RNA methylase
MIKPPRVSLAAALVLGTAASVHAQEHPFQQASPARDAFVKSAIDSCERTVKTVMQDPMWGQVQAHAQDLFLSKLKAACPCVAEKAANEMNSDEVLYTTKNKQHSDEFNALIVRELLICAKPDYGQN